MDAGERGQLTLDLGCMVTPAALSYAVVHTYNRDARESMLPCRKRIERLRRTDALDARASLPHPTRLSSYSLRRSLR